MRLRGLVSEWTTWQLPPFLARLSSPWAEGITHLSQRPLCVEHNSGASLAGLANDIFAQPAGNVNGQLLVR